MEIQVTEKWLGEIGGWQAMKTAREFVRLGSVTDVTREERTYRGLVGSGQRKFRATLVVGEGRNAEGRCGCPDAQRGLICAHTLAVALAAIAPTAPASPTARHSDLASASSKQAGQGTGMERELQPASSSRSTPIHDDAIPPGEFTIYIATEHLAAAAGQNRLQSGSNRSPSGPTVPVFLKFQPGGSTKEVAIGRWLLERSLPIQTMPLRLPRVEFGTFLGALVDHPRVSSGRPGAEQKGGDTSVEGRKLLVSNHLRVKISSERDIQSKNVGFKRCSDGYRCVDSVSGTWYWSGTQQVFACVPPDLPQVVLGFVGGLIETGRATQPVRWVAENIAALCQVLEPETEDDLLHQLRVLPALPIFRLRLDGNLRRVEAKLAPLLPDGNTEGTPAAYPVQDPQNPLLFYTRNPLAERNAQRRLEDAGFTSKADTPVHHSSAAASSNVWELKGEREVLRFLSSDLTRFRREFQVVEGEGWRHATRGLTIIRPKVRPPAGAAPGVDSYGSGSADWLSLEVAYEATDGFAIPRSEVLRLIRSGKRDVPGRDGRRYLLDAEGCEELEDMVQDMESHFESGNRLAVRGRQAEVLENFVERPEVLALHVCPPLDPDTLKAKLGGLGDLLRPYQLEGVRWMERHSRTRGGGILADEMGLGKTVQTLALLRVLRTVRASSGPQMAPALVICPTSLLNNWAEEAARFTPELRTHISHDSDRHESLARLRDFDVIFTSYALIVRDLEAYMPIEFSAIVLDEASYIRNPDTATAKAVRQLRAGCRFALTGTPVENSVRDLWSIFEFLVPRQLPARDDFQERFVKPLKIEATSGPLRLESGRDAPSFKIMERLRRLIRPNLLRRTKREVAKDLPEKIEKILWCELSGPQREVYQRLLDEGREEIRQARRRSGQGSARMTMFTVLLRLRQVCNDLRLVGIQNIDSLSPEETSGKWPVLEELLQETLEGGHKALIFSQFVTMLRLVREKVTEQGTPHSYLDGSTQDRAGEVAAFQTDPAKRLFLISLKAGGYGLNLTAADEVVLIDPWWNPAVEAQAIDRAHRIGQGRPVTAYRLVTRGTVEEKILKLQSQKRAVMDMALEDDAAVLTGVTEGELEAMLE